MLNPYFGLFIAAAGILAAASPAAAETREEYLDRLRYVCEVDCEIARDMVRAARKRDKDETSEMAVLVRVYDVTRWNDKYMLHTQPWSGFFQATRTPGSIRPELIPSDVTIELDEATFFDLLDEPAPGRDESEGPYIDREGNIIVERNRDMKFSRPTLRKMRSAFRNRRIAVRGMPRLVVGFTGASRRDFKNKRVFLEVDDAENLVVLPRFDKKGRPILEGPLAEWSKDEAR
ncbi:MAG: hypothetical protein AAF251_10015 [Pseudomonadota bacterium]